MLSWFERLEQKLTPEFGGDNGEELKRVFTLVYRYHMLFAVAVVTWSIATGFLEAGSGMLRDEAAPAGLFAGWNWFEIGGFGLLWGLASALKLLGALALLTLAAGTLGGILGFLFGLPSRSGAAAASGATDATGAKERWSPSTNLVQISDWLTKTIVGVSLVEAKSGYTAFFKMCHGISANLLDGAFGSGVVVPALLIGAGLLGFKSLNLYTLLYLARLIATEGEKISELTLGIKVMVNLEQLPMAISPQNPAAGATAPPTPEVLKAAIDVAGQPLSDLRDYSQFLAWARGKAILGDFASAAEGYRRLRPLMQPLDPRVLYEAASTLYQVGDQAGSKAFLADAVGALGLDAPADLRLAILYEYSWMALYDPPPAGYSSVLKYITDADVAADKSGWLALYRACANGQKYSFEATADRVKLRESVLADLKIALTGGPARDWVLGFADRKVTDRAQDLEPFIDDPEFRALVATATPK